MNMHRKFIFIVAILVILVLTVGCSQVQNTESQQPTKVCEKAEIELLRKDYPIMKGQSGSPLTSSSTYPAPLKKVVTNLLATNDNSARIEFQYFYAVIEYLGQDTYTEVIVAMQEESPEYLVSKQAGQSTSIVKNMVTFQAKVDHIICGEIDAIPSRLTEENNTVKICYNAAFEAGTIPNFQQGKKYLLLLACRQEDSLIMPDFKNCIYMVGYGEIYYITDHNIVLATQQFRDEYSGYSLDSFEQIIEHLYEKATSYPPEE